MITFIVSEKGFFFWNMDAGSDKNNLVFVNLINYNLSAEKKDFIQLGKKLGNIYSSNHIQNRGNSNTLFALVIV